MPALEQTQQSVIETTLFEQLLSQPVATKVFVATPPKPKKKAPVKPKPPVVDKQDIIIRLLQDIRSLLQEANQQQSPSPYAQSVCRICGRPDCPHPERVRSDYRAVRDNDYPQYFSY